MPPSIRASSPTRSVGPAPGPPLSVTSPSLSLATSRCRSAIGRDLGEMGDHQHLAGPGQSGQAAPDAQRRAAADPGVDLVEDEGGHRVGRAEHHLDPEHHPRQLTAGGALGQRPWRGAGMRRQHQLDLVDPVRAGGSQPPRARPGVDLQRTRLVTRDALLPDRDHEPSIRHGQLGQLGGHRPSQLGRSLSPTQADRPARPPSSARSRAHRSRQLDQPVVVAVQLEHPQARRLGPSRAPRPRRPRGRGSEHPARRDGPRRLPAWPGRTPRCRRRRRTPPRCRWPGARPRPRRSASVASCRSCAATASRPRRAAFIRQPASRRPRPPAGVTGQGGVRCRRSCLQLLRVPEPLASARSSTSSPGCGSTRSTSARPSRSSSASCTLARACDLIVSSSSAACAAVASRSVLRQQRGHAPAPANRSSAWRCWHRRAQPELIALPVHGDQLVRPARRAPPPAPSGPPDGPGCGPRRSRSATGSARRRPRSHRRPRAARSATGRVRVDPHPPLDAGTGLARADRAGVGSAAEQQAEPGHHHGLASTGLAGDHGQPGPSSSTASRITPSARRRISSSTTARLGLRYVGARPRLSARRASRAPATRTWPPVGR